LLIFLPCAGPHEPERSYLPRMSAEWPSSISSCSPLSAVHTKNDHIILSQDIQVVIHAIGCPLDQHFNAPCGPRSNTDQAVLSSGQPCRSPSIGVIAGWPSWTRRQGVGGAELSCLRWLRPRRQPLSASTEYAPSASLPSLELSRTIRTIRFILCHTF
jgi:hypothetical protein